MADSFDSYQKWLGIPPGDQPPHYYRLLGLKLFESDPEVIGNAADARRAYLESLASGPHGVEARRLIHEVSEACACLLSREHRAEYDAALDRSMHHRRQEQPLAPPPPPPQAQGLPARPNDPPTPAAPQAPVMGEMTLARPPLPPSQPPQTALRAGSELPVAPPPPPPSPNAPLPNVSPPTVAGHSGSPAGLSYGDHRAHGREQRVASPPPPARPNVGTSPTGPLPTAPGNSQSSFAPASACANTGTPAGPAPPSHGPPAFEDAQQDDTPRIIAGKPISSYIHHRKRQTWAISTFVVLLGLLGLMIFWLYSMGQGTGDWAEPQTPKIERHFIIEETEHGQRVYEVREQP